MYKASDSLMAEEKLRFNQNCGNYIMLRTWNSGLYKGYKSTLAFMFSILGCSIVTSVLNNQHTFYSNGEIFPLSKV